MSKIAATMLIVVPALLITGCSSSKDRSTRVSYVEHDSPSTYHHAESVAADISPAFDRTPIPADDSVHELPPPPKPTLPSEPLAARTVAMPEAGRFEITFDEFRQHVRNNSAAIVDARLPKDFKKGHVRGAINIPAGSEERYMDKLRKDVYPDALIIIYCGGPDCPAGETVASHLTSHGFTNVRLYRPGWEHLSKSDLVD